MKRRMMQSMISMLVVFFGGMPAQAEDAAKAPEQAAKAAGTTGEKEFMFEFVAAIFSDSSQSVDIDVLQTYMRSPFVIDDFSELGPVQFNIEPLPIGGGGGVVQRPRREMNSMSNMTMNYYRFVISGIMKSEITPRAISMRIVDKIREALNQPYERIRARLTEQLETAKKTQEEAGMELSRLRALERSYCEKAGEISLNRSEIQRQINTLENEKQNLEKNLAEFRVRREALYREIDRITVQSKVQFMTDPVSKEIEKLIGIRQERIKQLEPLINAGRADSKELLENQEALAQARIQLAEQQATMMKSGGGDQLASWNSDLLDLSIRIPEMEAGLKYTQTRLDEIKAKNLLQIAIQYETEVANRLEQAQNAVIGAENWVRNYQQQLENLRAPEVITPGQ